MPILRAIHNTVFKRSPAQSIDLPTSEKCNLYAGQTLEVEYAFRVGQHCFVKLKQALEPVGAIGYFFIPHVEVAIEELRGVWLTNVDSDVLHSQSNIQQALQQLKAIGFNTIYPVVWQRGFTLYPSAIVERLTGYSVMPRSKFVERDLLAEIIEVAKPLQMRVVPWFEYGLATLPNSDLAKRNAHLLSCDRQGKIVRIKQTDNKPDSFVWLNPCHPEVQRFFVEFVSEVVQHYQIDGIQLDDHFGFPVELGYDAVTQDRFRQDHAGKPLPTNPQHPEKVRWAATQLTHLFMQIVQTVKADRPDCIISLSPNPLGFSKANYAIDWQDWIRQGLIDELVLQVYRNQLSSFNAEIGKPEVLESCRHIPVAIGILSGLRTKPISTPSLAQQIQAVRQRQFSGLSCFFYETLFNERLEPESIARNQLDLQQIFY